MRKTFDLFPSALIHSFCCSCRQTAGTLRDGAESLGHALPSLPHDLREHDAGGRRGTREEAAANHPQLGLPQTAAGAGHAPPGGEEIKLQAQVAAQRFHSRSPYLLFYRHYHSQDVRHCGVIICKIELIPWKSILEIRGSDLEAVKKIHV